MDLGMLYGAVVVERLRTFQYQLANWEMHWERFQLGCDVLGINAIAEANLFEESIQHLLSANAGWIQSQKDVSIVVVATPGNSEFSLGNCTMYMHCLSLPWQRLRQWYQTGAALVRSKYLTGAGNCWPAPIKVRNRLAYYLADQDAAHKSVNALGIVGNARGNVGDTSVANVLMIDRHGEWISPTDDSVLVGTSLKLSANLLEHQGTTLRYRDIAWDELTQAKEIILVGNTGCVWHANSLDGTAIGQGRRGPECERLQNLWIEHLGFDWRDQAIEHP